jgi:hypothetical protein
MDMALTSKKDSLSLIPCPKRSIYAALILVAVEKVRELSRHMDLKSLEISVRYLFISGAIINKLKN